MNEHIKLLENKIIEILKPTKKELEHGLETVKWLDILYPNSRWEIRIAALAHDIERAVPDIPNMTPPKIHKIGEEDYEVWKRRHAQRSAAIMEHLMKIYLFEESAVQRVIKAISAHDNISDKNKSSDDLYVPTYADKIKDSHFAIGAHAVSDADSARFFDSGLPNYIEAFGIESAKIKARDMYKRCTNKTKEVIMKLEFNKEIKRSLKTI